MSAIKFAKIAAVVFWVGLATLMAAWFYGCYYLEATYSISPRQPNIAAQQIEPLKWKDTTVYVTKAQLRLDRIDNAITIMSAIAIGISALLERLSKTRSKDRTA